MPARSHPVVADVSDPAAVEQAVDEAMAQRGRIDVLANIAGGSRPGQDVVALDPVEWDRLMRVNLTSVYLMCRAVIPHMRAGGGGSIVNVSSGAGLRGMHLNPGYVAAKAGVVALTRALALDHGPEGIRTNCVAPGPVATPLMRRNRTPEEIEMIAKVSITGRLGEPEELAQVIAWLASDDSSYVMGQTIAVDGGVAFGGLSDRRTRVSGRGSARSGGSVRGGCFRGGRVASSSVVASVIRATASSKASPVAADGFCTPLTLRTYWREAASISSGVATGSSPRRVVMLRHMSRWSRAPATGAADLAVRTGCCGGSPRRPAPSHPRDTSCRDRRGRRWRRRTPRRTPPGRGGWPRPAPPGVRRCEPGAARWR